MPHLNSGIITTSTSTSTSTTSTSTSTTSTSTTTTTQPPEQFLHLSEISLEVNALEGEVEAYETEHGPCSNLVDFALLVTSINQRPAIITRAYGRELCNQCGFGQRYTLGNETHWECASSTPGVCNFFLRSYITTPHGTFMPGGDGYDQVEEARTARNPEPWGTPIVQPIHVTTTSNSVNTSTVYEWVDDTLIITPPKPGYKRKGICLDCKNECTSKKKMTECPFYEERVVEIDLSNIRTLFGCSILTYPFVAPSEFMLTVHGRTPQHYDLSESESVFVQIRDGIYQYETDYGEAPRVLYIHPNTHTMLIEEIGERFYGTRQV